jgi:hypothetical protein
MKTSLFFSLVEMLFTRPAMLAHYASMLKEDIAKWEKRDADFKERGNVSVLAGMGASQFTRIFYETAARSPKSECRYMGPEKLPDDLACQYGLKDGDKNNLSLRKKHGQMPGDLVAKKAHRFPEFASA